MEGCNLKRTNSYDRVMPRIYNRSHPSVKTNLKVTRHDTSTRIGAKPSSSSLCSSVFRELPLVLSGYEPETFVERPRVPKYVTKPRKTVKSLDPGKSPVVLDRNRQGSENNRKIRVRSSAPCVTDYEPMGWSGSHLRQCYSSRSHTRLKELKDEIKAFQKTEKLMQLRSHLYKKCGVVLDDTGRVAEDKAVQVQGTDNASGDSIRTEWREDARAAVSDQQVRPVSAPYPVDRYLVESRKQFDMVNIIDDDIWNPEPALRPEDEILLRKLHDMLQTTADDLKLLSGEMSKYHEPGVQLKMLPMPLDEEFNEKVHIEEVVNAKFYGNKIVHRTRPSPAVPQKKTVESTLRSRSDMINKNNASQSGKIRDLSMHMQPMKKKLQISRTHIMEIKEKSGNEEQTEKHVTPNNAQENKRDASPAVAYNEFSHKYIQPNVKKTPQKSLQIQEMPSIDIRSELRLQNVLQLDILPESLETPTQQPVQQNALVIELQYEPPLKRDDPKTIKFENSQYIPKAAINRPTTRKVSTITAYESSESNNTSSDAQHRLQKHLRNIPTTLKSSTLKQKVVSNTQKNNTVKKGTTRPQAYLEEWKRKLNIVYGKPSNSKNSDVKKKKVSYKNTSNKTAMTVKMKEDKKCVKSQPKSGMNNTEYIPYSKLTVGGVNVSDIEREISNIPNRNNIVLSPILDKILSSRENSFHNDSAKKNSQSKSPKILTTSDENLLQEVLDIEMKVAKTLNIDKNTNKSAEKIENNINDSTKDDSYADDFEDEKSDASKPSKSETSKSSLNIPSDNSCQEDSVRPIVTEEKNKANKGSKSDSNLTFTKAPSLSFKNKVDIFEFIHSVDTQETGTQSNTSNKITPKETQTSPRCDNASVQPIHNDLWPSIDPRGEVEKMLKLEKEFIKKLIIDEYGDLLEKSLTKLSTSRRTENSEVNVAALQKITQTSPAHVKSVMTSPTRTKTRTTSPFASSVAVYQQTSPVVAVSNEELKIELENDELGISANLSSPRFSLRLPQTSREVFSKLETKIQNNKQTAKLDYLRKNVFSSSSSVDGDYSSSDLCSLGELNKKFKRLKKSRIPSISEISSSSSLSKYNSDPSGAILPLRSEGEASIGQMNRRKTNKHSKSEGEVSLGQLR